MASISVIGTGYVGLCTGVVFAELGHDVWFVDVDPSKLEAVKQGRAPFYEPGVDEALQRLKGKVRTTTNVAEAVQATRFTFLCVGTPQGKDGAIDLGYIRKAAADVGAALRGKPDHVLVVKSTVVPGTAEEVVRPEAEKAAGHPVQVVSNPEFLKEGTAMADARKPDRVVVGATDANAAEAVLGLYAGLPGERIAVTPRTAEMIKYAANAFLAVKIAFSNEMANACEKLGIDWYDVVKGIGPDPRIGPLFLRAGVGFGGSCFPKDVAAIAHLSRNVGAPSGILDAVLQNNDRQALVAVDMLRDELGGSLHGKRVALLGLAFKADTDDVRETRALPLWHALAVEGAEVVCHDPKASANFLRLAPNARVAATVDEALRGADAAVVQTEWAEYRALDPKRMPRVVVDGRRTFEPAKMREAGVRYRAIGLGTR